jgi:2-polyprenyl-6-methoxyphenol hydroxylase-like FAD-dependent oxidoreductase
MSKGPSKNNKRILISGGGIGGITLAYFLKQYGFTPVIVESAPEFKHIGYLLALNKQIGQKVAEKMGILQVLKNLEVPLTNNIFSDEDGKKIMEVRVSPELHNDNTGLMINRADLHLALYDTVKNNVEFRFDKEISSITENEYGVDVIFSDTSSDSFDFVIGADGVNSKTRKLVFGEGYEKYLDVAYFAFIVQNRTGESIANKNDLVMTRGRDFLLAYHTIGKTEVGGYVFHKETPYLPLSPKERQEALTTSYGRYDQKFQHILKTLTDKDSVFHGSFTQIVMPTWHKGRVCLIGDAAHCPTPASGVGASLAMAGAYILAKKLAENDDYRKAFTEYDAYVRHYAQKAQKIALAPVKVIIGKSFLSYGFINRLLQILPSSVLTFILTKIHTHKLEMPLD